MKEDTPFKYAYGNLLILDLKVWVGINIKVRHEFYQKEVSTEMIFNARTDNHRDTKEAK